MTQWKSKREPNRTKAELREMLAAASVAASIKA
jgi:hypothetical protein